MNNVPFFPPLSIDVCFGGDALTFKGTVEKIIESHNSLKFDDFSLPCQILPKELADKIQDTTRNKHFKFSIGSASEMVVLFEDDGWDADEYVELCRKIQKKPLGLE